MTGSFSFTQRKDLQSIERWASIIGGSALIGYAIKKRTPLGGVLAVVGSDLIYGGLNGKSILRRIFRLQHGTAPGASASIPYRQGIHVDESVTIEKPREEVYSFWRNLENLPLIMPHLRSVTTGPDGRSHWIAGGPLGKTIEWDAEIISDRPNEVIAWRSLPGSELQTAGSVHFTPAVDSQGTHLAVKLQYDPPGGFIGAAVGILLGGNPAAAIRNDLSRFKQALEKPDSPSRVPTQGEQG